MDRKIRIYVGVTTTGTVVDSHVHALRRIEKRYGDRIEFQYPDLLVRRIFHDYARNCVVDEFLASNCDILWFLDSDVSPPTHVLDLVTEHYDRWKIAGCPYPVFMTPPGEEHQQIVFTVYNQFDKRFCPARIPYHGIDYVEGIATGCLFIKREVFQKLEKPYFEFKYRGTDRHLEEGEDLGFCKKVAELGYKFFIDYSMVCKHYKNICLLDLNNYAVDYANKAVKAYDQAIRSKVETLEEALRRKMDATTRPKSNIILPDDLR